MQSKDAKLQLSVFCKNNGTLSKSIALSVGGQPISDGSACIMSSGTAYNSSVFGLGEFAKLLLELKSANAIALGKIRGKNDFEVVKIVTIAQQRHHPDAISRSKQEFWFEPATPGLLLIDFDQKGMPTDVSEKLTSIDGVLGALIEVAPNLARAGYVQRASTSAGLSNQTTGEAYFNSGGLHIYIPVSDAGDIPRATKVLHQRLWLSGFGWHDLGAVGQILERSIVDKSVGSPERLVFEGPPDLEPPLMQSKKEREPIVVEGDVVDTKTAIPDLSAAEQNLLQNMLDASKRVLKPEAVLLQDKSDKRLATQLAAKAGISESSAYEKIKLRHEGKLAPLSPLEFDNPSLGAVPVTEVLLNRDIYVGETLADPLEGISYGRCKAKVLQRKSGALFIKSFAHGGAYYDLVFDYETFSEIIKSTQSEKLIEVAANTYANAQLAPQEVNLLVDQIKSKTGVNKPIIREEFKKRKSERDLEHSAAQRSFRPAGNRVRLRRPARDAELTPTLEMIDDVLTIVDKLEPPFRTQDGYLAHIVDRPVSGLHQLVNSDGLRPGITIEAPSQPLLTVANETAATTILEEHIEFFVAEENDTDAGRTVRLQSNNVKSYSGWQMSKLPRVQGIAELPIILLDGSVVAKNGLNRKLQRIFRIDKQLLVDFPKSENVTLESAKEAYRWLCDYWLVDVDTDEAGIAVIISIALSLIETPLLSMCPAFFLSAGQRGSGKTTVLNMVSMAVFGRQSAAASWSFNEEERRKSLFSYLRESTSFIVYDNIPRGTAIACPVIERVVTGTELKDRVLGESRQETVQANVVIAFTGNNIVPKGDMASRSLLANLSADRPDPENRIFQHDDPIAWSHRHRSEILGKLFEILLCPRDRDTTPKTRFSEWWKLIGQPIELVAGVNFNEMFRSNDALDEETSGVIYFIREMSRHFSLQNGKAGEFTAYDIVKLLNYSRGIVFMPSNVTDNNAGTVDGDALKSSLEDASGRPFTSDNVTAKRVAKKLQSIAGRPVNIDGQLLRLVVIPDHEGNRYKIEDLKSENG